MNMPAVNWRLAMLVRSWPCGLHQWHRPFLSRHGPGRIRLRPVLENSPWIARHWIAPCLTRYSHVTPQLEWSFDARTEYRQGQA